MYYNVVVGCSSSDVTSGALQFERPASFTAYLGFLIYMTKGGNWIQERTESIRQRFAVYKVKVI